MINDKSGIVRFGERVRAHIARKGIESSTRFGRHR
jgi:hypothetical protein